MEEFIVPIPDAELLRLEAQIPEDLAAQYEKSVSRGASAEIPAPFRAKSYISIGEFATFPLSSSQVSSEIAMQMDKYEFYSVHLFCSFEPAYGCRFFDGRFGITMNTSGSSAGHGEAIAYDLYPRLVEDTLTISRKYSVSADMSFDIGIASPRFAGEQEQSKDFIIYSSKIIASGLRTNTVAWRFMRTASHEIIGPQELFMLVRKPKNSQIWGIMRLAAQLEVITSMGPFGPFPLLFSRRGDAEPLLADLPSVPLC